MTPAELNEAVIPVPEWEYLHYYKYLLPQERFSRMRLSDKGIENLNFKGRSVVPKSVKHHFFTVPNEQAVWENFRGICIDCPPSETQEYYARAYFNQFGHYQHWTYNKKETYEQMVGDECYDGINS
jgi:hypothetical protein